MKTRYSLPQICLHWLTLLLVLATYSAMWFKNDVPDEQYDLVKNLHFNFGVAIWVIMFIRLGLSHSSRSPAITPPLSQVQAILAKISHWVLYLIFLALPILGVLTQAYGGKEWPLLGWNVPQFVTPDPAVRRLLKNTHENLATISYFVIGLHTLAALYHHYLRRDDTLKRMMP